MTLQQFFDSQLQMSSTDHNGRYIRVTTYCVRIVSQLTKQFAIRVARSKDGYRFGYNAILINEDGVQSWTKELSPNSQPFANKAAIFNEIYDFQALRPAFDSEIHSSTDNVIY